MPISDYMRGLREKLGSRLIEIPSVTVLLFEEDTAGGDDRLLLVRHADGGHWATPGGGLEPHEVPSDAAVREMWEETGLHVEPTRILGVFGGPEFATTYSHGDAVSFMVTVFLARKLDGAPAPDGDEIREVRAFTHGETLTLDMPEWARRIVACAFADRRDPAAAAAHFDPPSWSPG